MLTETEALDLWHKALAEPLGICIRTDHRRNLMTRMYTARAKSDDERLRELELLLPLDEQWLLIRRKPVEVPQVPVKPATEDDLDSL